MSDLAERLRLPRHHLGCRAIQDEAAVEIERLIAALEEIASDPTGISSYQADVAKRALGEKRK